MKSIFIKLNFLLIAILIFSCRKKSENQEVSIKKFKNQIEYASGFEIYKYDDFSILKIKKPWPNANKTFIYILKKGNVNLPDSLKNHVTISVPIKSVIATSTTHIASLTALGVEKTLVGFPNLDYISASKVRQLIHSGKIKELGNNQLLNIEAAIELNPSVVIGYGLDNNNPSIDNLIKSGIKVILNGDWNENSPLGKAEWIKFFGALYGKEDIAKAYFDKVVKEYKTIQKIASKEINKPTVIAGSMFEQTWHVPQGESWGAQFIKDAGGRYFWENEKGTGGLPLSFEKVYDKANEADFWIGPGQFSTLTEMEKSNPHYKKFKAFKNKSVFSYSLKKGEKGGIVYFEEAPNRPDLVLKDLVKIFHPNLITDYQLHFFQKLK